MASSIEVNLDMSGPANPSISLDGGATYSTSLLCNSTIGTDDVITTGYQMKLWGDVDESENVNIQTAEEDSEWISFSTSQQIKWSAGDGTKTINLRLRDDVLNESTVATDTIILDTTSPIITITGGPTPAKISKVTGKRVTTFSFRSDEGFEAYEVMVVANAGDGHASGTLIGVVNGSVNMSGSAGGYAADTDIECTLDGADLETAGAEGVNVIKVFVQDEAGNWSI